MNQKNFNVGLFFICMLLITSCYYDNKEDLYDYVPVEVTEQACDSVTISYMKDIVPVLDLNCNLACHNADDRLGNVILETYNFVTPYVNDGSLIGSIQHDDGFEAMPLGGKLTKCDLDKFRSWIADGAPNN